VSTANLLNLDGPAWEFWEAMEHRRFLGAMAPLTRFTVLPYNLDPIPQKPGPASRFWMHNHQRAQSDAIETIPTWGFPGPGFPPYPGTFTVAVPENQNLQDTHMTVPGQRTWFQFANHMEHYIASANLPSALLPAW
jgi:hypothetical protein